MTKILVKVALLCALAIGAVAQETPSGPPPSGAQGQHMRDGSAMRGHMGRGVMGEITAVNADGYTLKTMQGNSATVKVTPDTKIMRNREPIKMSDLKVGDTIGVMGTPDPNDPTTWNANFIMDRTAQMKEFRENLGKTMIAGEVKAIDGTKLTILRPDGQTQTIEADENTSFRKGRESVTLADIKVGDHVMGRGSLKDGMFVPSELRVAGARGMGMMGDGGRDWHRGGGPGQNQAPNSQPQSN